MRTRVAIVLLLTSATTLLAAEPITPSVPPWLWEDAERLERRYDAALAKERLAADGKPCTGSCEGSGVVNGKRNPELLMPYELMDVLAGYFSAPAEGRVKARNRWARRVPHLDLGEEFFDRLYVIGKPYFDARIEQQELFKRVSYLDDEPDLSSIKPRVLELESTICPLRADALEAARQAFGRDVFDQFLYGAIAPRFSSGFSGVTSARAEIERELWVQGGCR